MRTDRDYMQRALELAERGRGRTSPNPMVGCVVVRDGEIVGEGYHARAGADHAEVNALREAGVAAGATVYVTLEPCCHQGRTPPCTEVLAAQKPARVVAAMEDPNPQVSGRGFEALRKAGCAVEVGLMEDSARKLNEVFVKFVMTGKPFVIAKCAMSLDGKIATRTGDSRWVTGEASRARVHALRDEVDAILVGSRTVMMDDPRLTTRLPSGGGRDPIRVILDGGDYLDANQAVFHLESDAPTWVVLPEGQDFEAADAVIPLPAGDGGIDFEQLMKELGAREVASVLVEGGGTTLASAFEAGIVDKVMFFLAPKIVGGREAVTAVEGNGVERMAEALRLEGLRATPVGEDLLIEAYVAKD